MARTQAADYDQRREEIVVQAARLYAKHGFLGASVADLAAACDVSKSAIYHYYTAKEDILFDVMQSHIAALEDAAREAVRSSAEPAEQLRLLAHFFMRLYVGAADRHKVLLNDLDHLPAERRAEVVSIQRGLIAEVENILKAVDPTLAADPGRARVAAMLFFGMINWTHTWFDASGPVSASMLADMAVDLTLRGLPKNAQR